jgi:hypothetical protein
MADPRDLTPGAVSLPPRELRTAVVLDDVVSEDQLVRCVVPSLDPQLATDPMRWEAFTRPSGFFYPKRGDEALLAYPLDGPPVVLRFWPKAATPDVPL